MSSGPPFTLSVTICSSASIAAGSTLVICQRTVALVVVNSTEMHSTSTLPIGDSEGAVEGDFEGASVELFAVGTFDGASI